MAGSECAEPDRSARMNEALAVAAADVDAVEVGEYRVPVDPMDDLQCDSCQ